MTDEEKKNQELTDRLRKAEEALDAIRKGEKDSMLKNSQQGQIHTAHPEAPFQIFIEKMVEGAVILSEKGEICYANRSFIDMIGYPSETVLQTSILDFIQEEQRHRFLEFLKNPSRKKSEFHFLSKNKQAQTVAISISEGEWKDSKNFCLLISDITDIKRAQQIKETSDVITKILNTTSPPAIIFKLVIEELKNFLDWDLIIVWNRNKKEQTFYYLESAHIQNLDVEAFLHRSKELALSGEKMLPTRVWSAYRPIWIEDITEEASFLRRNEALICRLRGALAFPYYYGAELGGVIELYRSTPFRENLDEHLFNFIVSMGISVGLYIERKRAEAVNLYFSNIVNTVSCGIYSIDHHGIVNSWNSGAELIFGWKAEEIIGNSIKRIYPRDKEYEFEEILKTLNEDIAPQRFQQEVLRKDKTPIRIESSFGIIKYQWGEILEFSVVVEDISLKKASEETLTHYQEKLDSFFEMTMDWIWEIDKGGNITSTNKAVGKILGYQNEEVLGKNIFNFLSPDEREMMQKEFLECIMDKKGWSGQVHYIQKNGSDCWLESSSKVVLNEAGELLGFRGISRDNTQVKGVEKIKNEFISTVSHELRTPLISIHSAIALLKAKEMTPDKKAGLLEIAERNSSGLIELINNIMDVERLQEGKFIFDFKILNLSDVVLDSINKASGLAKGFNVKIMMEGSFPITYISGDYARLLQVMSNLLSNAIKFSLNGGTIRIGIEIKDKRVRVSVQDSGIGIPKEFHPKIFEKFAQADSSTTRTYGGTGLGLHICKSIIEGHGGKIEYTTKDGSGTTFYFELPIVSES